MPLQPFARNEFTSQRNECTIFSKAIPDIFVIPVKWYFSLIFSLVSPYFNGVNYQGDAQKMQI